MYSLTNVTDQDFQLSAGEYVVTIDPMWHESASFDKQYKEIVVVINAPFEIEIQPIDNETGLEILEQQIKDVALNFWTPETKYSS